MEYVLRIPYRDGTIDVRVDDRMYLLTPDLLVHQSIMKKFGVRVGSILLVISRGTLDESELTVSEPGGISSSGPA